jgi:hypothetical protein
MATRQWLKDATDYITKMEDEARADHKAFYDGGGRDRVRAAIGVLQEQINRLQQINRG